MKLGVLIIASIAGLALVGNAVQLSMSRAVTRKASSLYEDATQQILDNLKNTNTGALTEKQLENMINAAVQKAFDSDKEKNPGLTLANCKLTVDWSYTTPWIKLAAGEINVCKVTAALAGGIVLCKTRPEIKACALAELKKVGSVITEVKEADLEERYREGEQRVEVDKAEKLGRTESGDTSKRGTEAESRGRVTQSLPHQISP